MRFTLIAAVVLVLFGMHLGCGARSPLDNTFPDNRPDHVRGVLKSLPAPSLPRGPANDTGRPMVVVALAGDQPGLAAFDAGSGEELWRASLQVDSPPFVGGPVVVVRSGQEVVGLSVRNGSRLWALPTETIDFMGAAIDDGVVVLTFSTAGQRASVFREGRAMAVDARTGAVLWAIGPVEKQLGAPALRGGLAFVPWDRLGLSVFDVEDGREVARLLSRDDVYGFVRAGPEGVYYGSSGVYRLTESSSSGSRGESAVYEPLVGNAPGRSAFGPDGFRGAQGGRSALNKIRFLWRGAPEEGEDVSLMDDRAYFLYFRILFAFEGSSGAVRWAFQADRDAEASAVVPGGVLLLDRQGGLLGLDAATGSVVHRLSLDVPVATAAFDVATLPRGGSEQTAAGSAREQLLDIIFDPDTRLAPARRFAVSILASVPEPEVTRDLLDVCRNRRVPDAVRSDAAMVLRTRRSGAQYLREGLGEHYDFLEARDAPPVAVIAASAVHMEDSSVVPHLLEHFTDPETPEGDLPLIISAMATLGDASMLPRLRRFLVRYRADSTFEAEPATLVEVARAIVQHGDDADKDMLRQLAEQPGTLSRLSEAIAELLAPADGESAESQELRRTMTREQVDEVMQAARDRIRPCIQAALARDDELTQVAMTMVVTGEGTLEELSLEPSDDVLGSCLTLALAESSFPASDLDSQRVEYSIGIQR